MRFLKNFAWLLAGVCVGCLAGRMLLPWLTAERPEDDFAAAQLLLEDTEKGGDGLWFRRDTVNAAAVCVSEALLYLPGWFWGVVGGGREPCCAGAGGSVGAGGGGLVGAGRDGAAGAAACAA